MKSICVIVTVSLLLLPGVTTAFAQEHSMSFFITSVGMGKGGDLGGLEGADAHCQKLAESADEKGRPVKGRYDKPNEHDILTGTQVDGTPYWPDDKDHTCNNWTSSGEGSAQVGHHDRHGGGNTSWNSAHPSRGCSQEALRQTGGAGLLYCFAAD